MLLGVDPHELEDILWRGVSLLIDDLLARSAHILF
jgi:hypothetical protein